MKKIIIVLISLIILFGCGKNETTPTNETNNLPKEPEIVKYTEDEAQLRLKDIAVEVYNNKEYELYTKKSGKYYISLKELRNTLKYDTKVIDNINGLVCDENETGISIDIDNLDKEDYFGLPVTTQMLCNPPTNETNDNNS